MYDGKYQRNRKLEEVCPQLWKQWKDLKGGKKSWEDVSRAPVLRKSVGAVIYLR